VFGRPQGFAPKVLFPDTVPVSDFWKMQFAPTPLTNESDAEKIALMVVESGPPQAGPWNGQQDGG
jgi:hypothetical protein